MSVAYGVVQSDLLIQSFFRAAIEDLRVNRWKLKYALSSLAVDPLISREYGGKIIDKALAWFLDAAPNIAVSLNVGMEDPKPPMISIGLAESRESDVTVGETHQVPSEETDFHPALCDPFTGSWSAADTELTLPPNFEIPVYSGMKVFAATGQGFAIESVRTDDNDQLVVKLPEGTRADFRGAVIKAGSPHLLSLRSSWHTETFLIGVHTQGAMWGLVLHSIIVFALYHFRSSLLEARGFQVGSISSSDFARNQQSQVDGIFSRYITLTGKVQQVWPVTRERPVDGLEIVIRPDGSATLPPDGMPDVDEAGFIGEDDIFSRGSR